MFILRIAINVKVCPICTKRRKQGCVIFSLSPGDLVGVALESVRVLEGVGAVAGERLRVRLARREDVLRLPQQLRHRQVVAVHRDLQRRQPLLQMGRWESSLTIEI